MNDNRTEEQKIVDGLLDYNSTTKLTTGNLVPTLPIVFLSKKAVRTLAGHLEANNLQLTGDDVEALESLGFEIVPPTVPDYRKDEIALRLPQSIDFEVLYAHI